MIQKHVKSQRFVLFLFAAILGVGFAGCKKLLEIDAPIQNVVGAEIYNDNSSATTVVVGMYATMLDGSFLHGMGGIPLYTGLSSDELNLDQGNIELNFEYLYTNAANNNLGNPLWINLYSYIFRINAAIEGIRQSTGLSTNVQNQLLGECKFLRAYMYFNLVNLYADIPLLVSTDPKTNLTAGRESSSLVYDQIIADLNDAKLKLKDFYIKGDGSTETSERLRPNKAVAASLLAKVYLYQKKWDPSEKEATYVLDNSIYGLEDIENVFSLSSKETIWCLKVGGVSQNLDGLMFNLQQTDMGPNAIFGRPVWLSDSQLSAFEPTDKRLAYWVGNVQGNSRIYSFPRKYKTDINTTTITEFPVVFRLAELYLIRAEARLYLNKVSGSNSALSDLNAIRARAGVNDVTSTNTEIVLNAIIKERQRELFTEGGNRWMDLRRYGIVDKVMGDIAASKGATWQSFKSLYPIPAYDIANNPNLRGHQNPGYPEQ
jgi:hypothetical protein